MPSLGPSWVCHWHQFNLNYNCVTNIHPQCPSTSTTGFIGMDHGQAWMDLTTHKLYGSYDCIISSPLIHCLFTGFQPRRSSSEERVWMMLWLRVGQAAFYPMFWLGRYLPHFSWNSFFHLFNTNRDFFIIITPYILPLPFLCVPQFGGSVVVSKMLLEFGTCSLYP